MRIVAGELRGRSFKAPVGRDTRPTTDRIRESIFSAAYSQLGSFDGLRVLDLYAGSGALGLEALSRGAASVTGVESSPVAARTLLDNVGSLGLADRYTLLRRDALKSAAAIAQSGPFDLVFADPPYAVAAPHVLGLLGELAHRSALSTGALVVYEHDARSILEWPAHFTALQQKSHGSTGVSYAVFELNPTVSSSTKGHA